MHNGRTSCISSSERGKLSSHSQNLNPSSGKNAPVLFTLHSSYMTEVVGRSNTCPHHEPPDGQEIIWINVNVGGSCCSTRSLSRKSNLKCEESWSESVFFFQCGRFEELSNRYTVIRFNRKSGFSQAKGKFYTFFSRFYMECKKQKRFVHPWRNDFPFLHTAREIERVLLWCSRVCEVMFASVVVWVALQPPTGNCFTAWEWRTSSKLSFSFQLPVLSVCLSLRGYLL